MKECSNPQYKPPGSLINQAGIDLIKEFEGLRLKAYKDPVGILTIGFGHTRGVTQNMVITPEEAELFLIQDINEHAQLMKRALRVNLNDNQFAAMTSILFNVGPGNSNKSGIIRLKTGEPSTLFKHINKANYNAAASEFGRWVFAGGKVLKGLQRRREAERKLFETPMI